MHSIVGAILLGSALAQEPLYPQGGGNCSSEWDCSLGGVCEASACICDAWWTGPHCDLLNLQPAKEGNGLSSLNGYYSWGGHALADPVRPDLFHGFFSFLCRHMTLASWTSASSIWHATAAAIEGPYALADMVAQPWSHNAYISTTGDGAAPYAVYQIGDAVADPSLWSPCFNASEDTAAFRGGEPRPAARPLPRSGSSDGIFVRSAPSLSGPWTPLRNNTPLNVTFEGSWAKATNGGNPAPFFFSNGSVLLYFSANPCPPNWGNKVPGNNCIAVARGDSWQGPFATLPLPITAPESEDPAVFRDPRGHFHVLTNVNNDHARCAQGVPCGGHAWSYDGITFSNLTIGAFGPVIRFANGTSWTAAYVERPQVTQAADGTPLAFFVGMSRSSYDDSTSWVQLFCVEGQAGCGPTLPPPPAPPVAVRYTAHNGADSPPLCLGSNASFPCPGGWADSCPTFLVACSDATAVWLEHADGSIESAAHTGNCLNIDCNSCSAHTITKLLACENADALDFVGSQLRARSCAGSCLDDGSSGAAPPCKAGEFYMPAAQVSVEPCAAAATSGWLRKPI